MLGPTLRLQTSATRPMIITSSKSETCYGSTQSREDLVLINVVVAARSSK